MKTGFPEDIKLNLINEYNNCNIHKFIITYSQGEMGTSLIKYHYLVYNVK